MNPEAYLIRFVAAYIFSGAFALAYGLQQKKTVALAALGGALGWLTYDLLQVRTGTLMANFYAALVFSFYSELMARICRKPASIFLIIALLPLVPGGGIYRSMAALVEGQNAQAGAHALETLGTAALLALGVVIISSLSRVQAAWRWRRRRTGRGKPGPAGPLSN